MSRVTPPVTKFTHSTIRSLHASARAARPSPLLESQTQVLKGTGSKTELVDRLVAHDLSTRNHSTVGAHRPSVAAHATPRARPLMQGFRTSAVAAQPAADRSTIDFTVMPAMRFDALESPLAGVRIPLLPDNYAPDRSLHAVEEADAAVPRPEILVVASHPETVAPAAMTEVVGNDGVETRLEELTRAVQAKVDEIKEPGAVQQFFSDLLDDVLGPKRKLLA